MGDSSSCHPPGIADRVPGPGRAAECTANPSRGPAAATVRSGIANKGLSQGCVRGGL
ncbi:hypothetical protein chiPu_0022940, partial [Chiloscyllium punctatum]|nr:hypothetical protein [Chiloscyllium punctatum]